ncbi:Na+/H+ antiporter [Williamsia sterculiae]|uniref:Sodium/proton antiporter, CPA1 family n=1 Tax=Williamsia sterculiae TaxID=1344003 RepID=A0A1N7CQ00_9NOCA|nr:Na+/H+ antiporter [Williamsia sterculiae]SIR65643.1 sodium/proton antiporter, CPA1 family [Williamsia sterculiae]
MNEALVIVAVAALAIAALARRYQIASPLVLVVLGICAGLTPVVPDFHLDPDLVLFVILPPLLYSAARDSSYMALRRNARAIGLLAIGLPLFTTLAVALVAHWVVPDLPWAAAFVLGAVVAPPDAVSAQAIGRRLGLPRRITTLLGGESLLNDATSLTAYRLALAAVVGTATSAWDGLLMFAVALVGGAVVGLVIGIAVGYVRRWLDDPPMETAISILVPFGTYLIAEEIHSSGVIAVVVAGVFLGQRSSRAGYLTRMQDTAVWRSLDVIFESFVFLIIGLQVPQVIGGLSGHPIGVMAWSAIAVLAVVIVSRFVWMFPATYLPRLIPRIRSREEAPTVGAIVVTSWSGMRGVVSLAAAFAIPLTVNGGAPFPGRDEIIFLTFVVVVGTLLIQGTTLPWVIVALRVHGTERQSDLVALAAAQDRAGQAAVAELEELAADIAEEDARHKQVLMLRHWIHTRKNLAWEELGRNAEDIGESPTEAYNRMRTRLVQVQREVFINERDAGRIDDEVLRRALRDLDLAEGLSDRRDREA